MITRPFNFESHLKEVPARFETVPFINVALLGLFFVLLSSRFVLAPGISLDLPAVEGTPRDLAAATRVLTLSESEGAEMLIFEGRMCTLESFQQLLEARPGAFQEEVLLVRADHDVSLQVSDGTDTALQDFTITVVAATGVNNAPTFSSTAVTDAEEGVVYTYDVVASDVDAADVLEITAPTLPSWLTLTDNGDGTATLTGTPTAAEIGDHAVSLQVSDGTDTALQDFTVTVVAATGVNNAPAFTSTAVVDATPSRISASSSQGSATTGWPAIFCKCCHARPMAWYGPGCSASAWMAKSSTGQRPGRWKSGRCARRGQARRQAT